MKTLVAIDGSEAAFGALGTACRLAARTRSYVSAIYVNKSAEYTPEETGWPQVRDRIETELESRGQELLRRAAEIGRGLGVEVERIMAYGLPAEQVARYTAAHGIVNLVVFGHSSKSRGAQGFVGSTARMAVAMVERASLLVTSREQEIRRIVVAVDESEASARAAAAAGRLASALPADVRLVAIYPDVDAIRDEYRQIAEVPNLDAHIARSRSELREQAFRALERAQSALAPLGLSVTAVARQGRTVKALAEEAREADLTALGLARRPPEGGIGSTLSRLLEHREISLFCVQ